MGIHFASLTLYCKFLNITNGGYKVDREYCLGFVCFVNPSLKYNLGFLNLGTIDILAQIILSYKSCPKHCRCLAVYPDLHEPDVKSPNIVKCPMGSKSWLLLKTTTFNYIHLIQRAIR